MLAARTMGSKQAMGDDDDRGLHDVIGDDTGAELLGELALGDDW